VERDHVERVALVRVHRGREAELARQAVGDLEPRLAAVVAAMDADVVLLVHARGVRGRAHEPVHAEAALLVRTRPVGAQTLVPRCPRLTTVTRLEDADALHDRPEACVVVAVEHHGRDAEVAGRLVRRVVPELAAGLAGKGGEERPGLAAVAALKDAGRLDADEDAAVPRGERRDLGDLARIVVAVADALARERPRLAEVVAAPDGRP